MQDIRINKEQEKEIVVRVRFKIPLIVIVSFVLAHCCFLLLVLFFH